jgi:hypothetical protein
MKPSKPTIFCLECSYPLDGLKHPRCPECGKPFTFSNPNTYSDRPRSSLRDTTLPILTGPLVVIPIVWVAVFFGPLSMLAIPIILAAAIVYVRRKRFVSFALILVLTPFTVFSTLGVVDYARGTARIARSGLPSTRFGNVDPVYRHERASRGCLVYGNEWVFDSTYSATVFTLIKTIGPMRGSYLGPYPTEQQATAALLLAKPIQVNQLQNDIVTLGTNSYTLDAGVGAGLLARTEWGMQTGTRRYKGIIASLGPITAVITQGTCLILRIPTETPWGSTPQAAMVVLIDTNSGRPFAYYPQGNYSHHFPPVRWHK